MCWPLGGVLDKNNDQPQVVNISNIIIYVLPFKEQFTVEKNGKTAVEIQWFTGHDTLQLPDVL